MLAVLVILAVLLLGSKPLDLPSLPRRRREEQAPEPFVPCPPYSNPSLELDLDSESAEPGGSRGGERSDDRGGSASSGGGNATGARNGTGSNASAVDRRYRSTCLTVFITTFFTTKKDPQRGGNTKQTVNYLKRFAESLSYLPGTRAVVLHDGVSSDVIKRSRNITSRIDFMRINISDSTLFDPNLGLNDVRFLAFEQLLLQKPSFQTVFLTDISDVEVLHNPCELVDLYPEKLFVGGEPDDLAKSWYMEDRYEEMGGKYQQWFQNATFLQPNLLILNAGMVGGRVSVFLRFLKKMNEVISDPELTSRKEGKEVKVNMAALNWVLNNEFSPTEIYTGGKLHSTFKGYEKTRCDVYMRHK